MLIMTFLMVQGQRSPCKMKVHVWVSIWHCNYSPIWYRFRDIDLQIYPKNDYILFSAGGPDAANDLKLVSVIKNLSIYHMPKYQNWNTKKKFIFFGDLNFDLHGHPRSKVMVSNESLIMFFYLTSIVTICLTCFVSEIWYPKGFWLIRLIRLIVVIWSMSKKIIIYSCRRWIGIQKKKNIDIVAQNISRWKDYPIKIFTTSAMTFLVVQGQISPCKMKLYIWVPICG